MSISMKSLINDSSLDDDEDVNNVITDSKEYETHPIKIKNENSEISQTCSPILLNQAKTPSIYNSADKCKNTKKQLSLDLKTTTDDTKSHWLKEQVSGSFKRLSTRISPANSLDNNSFCESFESSDGSKSISEVDLSRKRGLKDHFSNYISKSKNYYHNRFDSQSQSDLSAGDQCDLDNNITLSSNNLFEISNDMSSSSPVNEMVTFQTTSDVIKNIDVPEINVSSSFSCNENYLPFTSSSTSTLTDKTFKPIRHPSPQIKKKVIKKDTNKNRKDSYGASKLTFSELLTSHKSPASSNSPPVETAFESTSVLSEEAKIEELANTIIQEDLKSHLRPSTSSQIKFSQLWLTVLLLYVYMLSLLPSYFAGFVTGCLCMYFLLCSCMWLLCPSADIYTQYKTDLKELLVDNALQEGTSVKKKSLPKAEALQKPRDFKGWMSLGSTYEDYNYEKEKTQDVYSVIHKDILFLFINKERIDKKTTQMQLKYKQQQKKGKKKKQKIIQKSLEEEEPAFVFECQWTINLSKCMLKLKPDDLPIRRMWNKKYPIKIIIPKSVLVKRNIDLSLEELTLSLDDILEGVDIHANPNDIHVSDEEKAVYLFGNTGREKEDWFYRMQLCVKPLQHQFGVNDSSLSSEPHKSYPHYMVDLITESEKVMQRSQTGKKMEPYLAWLNIFLGRAFWDFWHDQYWTNKLHQKIQTRLSKINTPPFITNIKLKQLNCGHNIPIIHKGSVPVLDEYGIWTDLQITYKGYFTLTLETQLNVDYYVGLVSSIVKQKAGISPKDHSELSKLTKMSELSNDVLSHDLEEPEDVDVNTFHEELQNVYFEDEPEGHLDPLLKDPRTKAFLDSRAGKKMVDLVGWLAKSKLAKRVAETDFAKKAYEKAYEKFRKMPIILKVEIQSVRGNLAVNIPPPPTNRLWFGFRGNPVIFITATPKVGDKQVRLTYLTSWIEKKLKEEFKKYLVLPSMQDLSIKLMDSQLSSLHPERPTS